MFYLKKKRIKTILNKAEQNRSKLDTTEQKERKITEQNKTKHKSLT